MLGDRAVAMGWGDLKLKIVTELGRAGAYLHSRSPPLIHRSPPRALPFSSVQS